MKTDWATLLGLLLAVGGISAGLVLEGGSVLEILQPTAALIVFGGTIGATLVAQPMGTVRGALRQVFHLFAEPRHDVRPVVEQIVELAQKARRLGIISLDKEIGDIAADVIYTPATLDFLQPIPAVVALQLFAYYCALDRGCDIDQPRNLAKSVTVE